MKEEELLQFINAEFNYSEITNSINKGIKYNLTKIKITDVKHIETINLLKQSNNTLINIEKLLKKHQFIDANSLLRSAYEYLMMGMSIELDESIFNEFKLISMKNRQTSNPSYIIKTFKNSLPEISEILFEDMSNKELNNMLNDLYDNFCKYVHGNITVSVVSTIKDKLEIEILCDFLYIYIFLIKILLYCSLKYLTKINKDYTNFLDLASFFIKYPSNICNKAIVNKINFNKYNKLFYFDDNISYYNKNKNEMMKSLNELEKLINKNNFKK